MRYADLERGSVALLEGLHHEVRPIGGDVGAVEAQDQRFGWLADFRTGQAQKFLLQRRQTGPNGDEVDGVRFFQFLVHGLEILALSGPRSMQRATMARA